MKRRYCIVLLVVLWLAATALLVILLAAIALYWGDDAWTHHVINDSPSDPTALVVWLHSERSRWQMEDAGAFAVPTVLLGLVSWLIVKTKRKLQIVNQV